MTAVIVVNGGSSSGKPGIARCLQAVLPGPWPALGTDTLVDAMPASMRASDAGIEFGPGGEVIVGSAVSTGGRDRGMPAARSQMRTRFWPAMAGQEPSGAIAMWSTHA
jgi:hypothetical protein